MTWVAPAQSIKNTRLRFGGSGRPALTLVALLVLLVYLGASWLAKEGTRTTRDAEPAARFQAIRNASQGLLVNLLDAEAAVQRFLLIKDNASWQAYRAHTESAALRLKELQSALASRSGNGSHFDMVHRRAETFMKSLAGLTEETAREQEITPSFMTSRLVPADRAMQDLRTEVAALEQYGADELAHLADSDDEYHNYVRSRVWTCLLIGMTAIIAALWHILRMANRERDLRHAIGVADAARSAAEWKAFEHEFMTAPATSSPSAVFQPDEAAKDADVHQSRTCVDQTEDKEPVWRALLRSDAAALYLKDSSGRYLAANALFDSMFQTRAATDETDSANEPAITDALASVDAEALHRGVALYREQNLPGDAGSKRVLSVTIPLQGADGGWRGVLGILIDCGGRYEENGIQLGEMHLLQSVLHSMQDGVIVLDSGGRCLFSNSAARVLLGDSIASNPLNQWVSEIGLWREDSSMPYGTEELPLVQALLGNTVQRGVVFARRTESAEGLWLSATAIPLRDDAGRIRGAVGVFSDITERRNTENALNHAKEIAERANRAKSDFISRMSHELRTPLNAILGFAQLLEFAPLPEHHHDSAEQILKAGRHLLSLINEVLDIARIESGRLSLSLERFAMIDAVQEVVSLTEPQASAKKVQLYLEAGPAWRLHVVADRQRLKQVVLNLLSNAVKYNHEGGAVRISVESRSTYLRLVVADTGPGIPEDKLGLLFSPFARLGAEHTAVEGTGIGLALSKRLVEAMNGQIGVSTTPGQGSSFWIEFSIADATRDDPHNRDDLTALARHVDSEQGAVVLCIEDNESNYRLIERTLTQRPGIRLVSSALGASTVELARANDAAVILLDLHLPDLDGQEVLRRLKNNPLTAKTPVIVISADATQIQMERVLGQGAMAYLAKPFDIQQLLDVLDEALGNVARDKLQCTEV